MAFICSLRKGVHLPLAIYCIICISEFPAFEHSHFFTSFLFLRVQNYGCFQGETSYLDPFRFSQIPDFSDRSILSRMEFRGFRSISLTTIILSCSFFIYSVLHFFQKAQPAIPRKIIVCENSQQDREIANPAIRSDLDNKISCPGAATYSK